MGLSARTLRPAATERLMYSALRALLPEITTTLPGFSASIFSRKSSPV